jgi:hypothetical protein
VLLCVASGDPAKADRAEELIGAGGAISLQVLNEITNVARRKIAMSRTETRAFLSLIRHLFPVQPLTIDTHDRTGVRRALWNVDIRCHNRCTPIAAPSGPKTCRTGSCSMAVYVSSTRFSLRNKTNWAQHLDQPPTRTIA